MTMLKIKRLTVLLLAVVMIFTAAGCGSSSQAAVSGSETELNTASVQNNETKAEAENEVPETTAPVQEESENTSADTEETAAENETTAASDTLVVYFSRTGEQYTVGVIDHGNTAIVAEMIAEKTGADMFEILPEDDYYPMTYNELTDVAKREQNEKARPPYADEVPDLSQYSTIFIGAPVWWGDWPMIMYTFFENNQEGLAGKALIPFSTHEGSGLSGFDRKLSSACPESAVGEGLAIRGNDCQNKQDSVRESVDKWLSGLGF